MNQPQHNIHLNTIRCIGDTHNFIEKMNWRGRCYLDIVNNCEYSVQVGDFTLLPQFPQSILHLDSSKHKVLKGNHDNYDYNTSYHLGDFGLYNLCGVEFFFIRGERSVDKDSRTIGVDWWPQEELSYDESSKAINLYCETKPAIIITHGCPTSIRKLLEQPDWAYSKYNYPSHTSNILEACFSYHQPKLWVFGNYHVDWHHKIGSTQFLCLDELSTCDIDEKGNVVS